jgi:hypothetical protein
MVLFKKKDVKESFGNNPQITHNFKGKQITWSDLKIETAGDTVSIQTDPNENNYWNGLPIYLSGTCEIESNSLSSYNNSKLLIVVGLEDQKANSIRDAETYPPSVTNTSKCSKDMDCTNMGINKDQVGYESGKWFCNNEEDYKKQLQDNMEEYNKELGIYNNKIDSYKKELNDQKSAILNKFSSETGKMCQGSYKKFNLGKTTSDEDCAVQCYNDSKCNAFSNGKMGCRLSTVNSSGVCEYNNNGCSNPNDCRLFQLKPNMDEKSYNKITGESNYIYEGKVRYGCIVPKELQATNPDPTFDQSEISPFKDYARYYNRVNKTCLVPDPTWNNDKIISEASKKCDSKKACGGFTVYNKKEQGNVDQICFRGIGAKSTGVKSGRADAPCYAKNPNTGETGVLKLYDKIPGRQCHSNFTTTSDKTEEACAKSCLNTPGCEEFGFNTTLGCRISKKGGCCLSNLDPKEWCTPYQGANGPGSSANCTQTNCDLYKFNSTKNKETYPKQRFLQAPDIKKPVLQSINSVSDKTFNNVCELQCKTDDDCSKGGVSSNFTCQKNNDGPNICKKKCTTDKDCDNNSDLNGYTCQSGSCEVSKKTLKSNKINPVYKMKTNIKPYNFKNKKCLQLASNYNLKSLESGDINNNLIIPGGPWLDDADKVRNIVTKLISGSRTNITTAGNNGGMSCQNYCNKGINNETPVGSNAVSATSLVTNKKVEVNETPGGSLSCVCSPPPDKNSSILTAEILQNGSWKSVSIEYSTGDSFEIKNGKLVKVPPLITQQFPNISTYCNGGFINKSDFKNGKVYNNKQECINACHDNKDCGAISYSDGYVQTSGNDGTAKCDDWCPRYTRIKGSKCISAMKPNKSKEGFLESNCSVYNYDSKGKYGLTCRCAPPNIKGGQCYMYKNCTEPAKGSNGKPAPFPGGLKSETYLIQPPLSMNQENPKTIWNNNCNPDLINKKYQFNFNKILLLDNKSFSGKKAIYVKYYLLPDDTYNNNKKISESDYYYDSLDNGGNIGKLYSVFIKKQYDYKSDGLTDCTTNCGEGEKFHKIECHDFQTDTSTNCSNCKQVPVQIDKAGDIQIKIDDTTIMANKSIKCNTKCINRPNILNNVCLISISNNNSNNNYNNTKYQRFGCLLTTKRKGESTSEKTLKKSEYYRDVILYTGNENNLRPEWVFISNSTGSNSDIIGKVYLYNRQTKSYLGYDNISVYMDGEYPHENNLWNIIAVEGSISSYYIQHDKTKKFLYSTQEIDMMNEIKKYNKFPNLNSGKLGEISCIENPNTKWFILPWQYKVVESVTYNEANNKCNSLNMKIANTKELINYSSLGLPNVNSNKEYWSKDDFIPPPNKYECIKNDLNETVNNKIGNEPKCEIKIIGECKKNKNIKKNEWFNDTINGGPTATTDEACSKRADTFANECNNSNVSYKFTGKSNTPQQDVKEKCNVFSPIININNNKHAYNGIKCKNKEKNKYNALCVPNN